MMDIRCSEQTASGTRVLLTSSLNAEIRGRIRGPFCEYSRTLPSNFPIRDGQALIVDPCFWTPSLPFQYEVETTVLHDDGRQQTETFLWGLRWCQLHRDNVRLNGKRFVVRAIESRPGEMNLEELRAHGTSLYVPTDDEELFREASRRGVMLVVAAEADSADIRRLNRFPAVHFVRTPATGDDLYVIGGDAKHSKVRWVGANDMTIHAARHPTFVARSEFFQEAAEQRRACDTLQRDMSPFGQFAGYVILNASE